MIAQFLSSCDLTWDQSLLYILSIFVLIIYITFKIIGIEIGVVRND